jgi:hypothetical protein
VAVASTARKNSAAKVIGSVAIVAAAAGVAGLGTFGSFTDSTDAMQAEVTSASVSIDLAMPAQAINFPGMAGGWVPGDTAYLPVDLVNTGTADLASLTLAVSATKSSILDTNTTDGLQLTVQGCDQPWSTSTGAYTCAGTVTEHYAGPVVLNQAFPEAKSLAVGGRDHLLATVSLPESAGVEFMGAETQLSILFTGTQRTGTAR